MNYTADFDLCLKYGEIGESKLRALLADKKLECKRDIGVSKSGNVVVEYESRGKPSGISVTKSNYWAFMLSGEQYKDEMVIFIKTTRLKALLNKYNFRDTMGGDVQTSRILLIPLKEMFNAIYANPLD